MKLAKKAFAVLFATVLVLTACIGVFAGTSEIEITGAPDDHTFTAYQIFTGTVNTAGDTLSSIQWGSDVTANATTLAALVSALDGESFTSTGADDAVDALTASSTAAEFAGVFALMTDADDVKALAAILADWVTGTGTDSTETSAPYSVTGLDDGYYLVTDTPAATGAPEGDFVSNYILSLAGTATIATKGAAPTLDKTVTDVSTNGQADNIDVAVGDTLNFTLTGTLPTNYEDYTTYAYTFTDTPTNLAISSSSVKLYVDDTEVTDTTKFTVAVNSSTGILTVTIANMKLLTTDKTDVIKVTYSAEVQEGAVSAAATNEATITYSNDPNSYSTGETPPEEVTATTQSFKLVKYDGADNKLLAGATFNIKNGSATISFIKVSDTEYRVAKTGETGAVTAITTVDDPITIKGLDADVTYTLHEASAPLGYNPAADSTFTVSASTSSATPTINATTNVYTTTANVVGVANNSGSELPQTGGTGTIIFIVVGAVAVVVAGIFLVTNKRISKEDI